MEGTEESNSGDGSLMREDSPIWDEDILLPYTANEPRRVRRLSQNSVMRPPRQRRPAPPRKEPWFADKCMDPGVFNHEVHVLLPRAIEDDCVRDSAEWVAMRLAFEAVKKLYYNLLETRGPEFLEEDEHLKLVVLLVAPERYLMQDLDYYEIRLETLVEAVNILRHSPYHQKQISKEKLYKELRWEFSDGDVDRLPGLFGLMVKTALKNLPVEVRVTGVDEGECRRLADRWNAHVRNEKDKAHVRLLDLERTGPYFLEPSSATPLKERMSAGGSLTAAEEKGDLFSGDRWRGPPLPCFLPYRGMGEKKFVEVYLAANAFSGEDMWSSFADWFNPLVCDEGPKPEDASEQAREVLRWVQRAVQEEGEQRFLGFLFGDTGVWKKRDVSEAHRRFQDDKERWLGELEKRLSKEEWGRLVFDIFPDVSDFILYSWSCIRGPEDVPEHPYMAFLVTMKPEEED